MEMPINMAVTKNVNLNKSFSTPRLVKEWELPPPQARPNPDPLL